MQLIKVEQDGLFLSVLHGQVEDALQVLDPESVDLVVTSPPYKTKDGYSDILMERLGTLVGYVLRPGARAFINFSQLRSDFSRLYDARDSFFLGGSDLDLKTGQSIIWCKSIAVPSPIAAIESYLDSLEKGELADPSAIRRLLKEKDPRQIGHYQPLNSDKILNYCWEMVFTFYKTVESSLDRLALGVPFSDKSNMSRGTRGRHGDVHCGGDIWYVPYKTTGQSSKKKHDYEFPEDLVNRCIQVSDLPPGAVVMDPFGGSGTTPVVAKKMGFSSVAVERNSCHVESLVERWQNS